MAWSLLPYSVASTVLAVAVVLNSLYERPTYYSAAVYLSKSNACTLILWNFGIFLTICTGKLIQVLFFGSLRLIELERLRERLWYTITETLLALTIFKDEFDTAFVALFVSLLFVKVFHWLAADRVEAMEQSPTVSKTFHFRMICVLSGLWLTDLILIGFALESILIEGPSVMIMFASEYLICTAAIWATTLKYIINTIDLSSEIPWEGKSILVFYVDLATDFTKLLVYLAFFSFIMTFYGLPLNILRDVYLTARSFFKKVRDLSRYQLATKNMESRYPNATKEELTKMADKTCIICREEMTLESLEANANGRTGQQDNQVRTGFWQRFRPVRRAPNETPKKLPCGHLFHFHCLRSWLERQQSCPTCRRSVLPENRQPASNAFNRPAAPQPGQAPRPDNGATPDNRAIPPAPQSATTRSPHTQFDFGRADVERNEESQKRSDNPFLKFQLPAPMRRKESKFESVEALLAASKYRMPTIVAPELGVPQSLKRKELLEEENAEAEKLAKARVNLSDSMQQRLEQSTSVVSYPFPTAASPKSHLAVDANLPLSSPALRSAPTTPLLPDTLTDTQLRSMSRITRDGMEERLKLLENVQACVDKCTEQLRQALDVMPTDANRTNSSKGKASAEETLVNGAST